MNNKHIACLIIAFVCVLIIQGILMIRNRTTQMQSAEQGALRDVETAQVTLRAQRALLDDLKRKSSDLLGYLEAWEPYFSQIPTSEAGEIYINSLVKEAGLILLAQRFELVQNKSDSAFPNMPNNTIPQIVRAHLTIEDDFIKSINWLGTFEQTVPIARVSNIEISRGQSGNDLRMNLVLDVPLALPRENPSATP